MPTPETLDSACAAARILHAVRSHDLAGLAAELHRTCPPATGLSPDAAERWDLLDAVASEMRSALGRMRRGSIRGLDGAELHLRLLRHLAESHPSAAI